MVVRVRLMGQLINAHVRVDFPALIAKIPLALPNLVKMVATVTSMVRRTPATVQMGSLVLTARKLPVHRSRA